MGTPSVDMISDSIGSSSLGRENQSVKTSSPSPVTPQHLAAEDSSYSGIRVAVELNSETALPGHWEQFLNLKTGEVYYISLVTAVRTTKDPRAVAATALACESSYCITPSDDDDDYDYEDCDNVNDDSSGTGVGRKYDDDEEDTGIGSPSTSEASIGDSPGGDKTLVAAGCKSCLMYFMVPKRIYGCPKCGGRLIHLC